jgi:haloalkane dehalogenase
MADEISPVDPFPRQRVTVADAEMAYVEVGEGDPIVFLHGNPTSSYLWRNVLPHVQHLGRCLAPDLVGMGESGKLAAPGPGTYSFATHSAYLDGFFAAVGATERVTLVLHDWGSALGFDWAARHPEAVRGIAFTESIVAPIDWDEWPAAGVFRRMRGPEGEAAVLDENLFVELLLPGGVGRGLTPGAHDRYRRPFAGREDRWPTLEWPRQLPIEGHPADVVARVEQYGAWLADSDVPKLFVDADPGSVLVGSQRERVRAWPALTEVTVSGSHFVPEDSPHELGRAVADWLSGLG